MRRTQASSGSVYFATCPAGVADLLAAELREFGATGLRELKAGVAFEGSLETAYRACLWSRTASRILHTIGEVAAADADELYAGIRSIDWSQHVDADGTIAIDVIGTSDALKHTRFTAQRVKDGVVDAVRAERGIRPSVDLARPDVRINVRLRAQRATIAIDLAGDALHRRGYRLAAVAAPLKENLAAAVLLRSGWPQIAAAGGELVDPMCGSGTFVIEAALIALGIAPGLLREHYGFERWRGHDAELWRRLVSEAASIREQRVNSPGAARFLGFDSDPRAIRAATENAQRAGVAAQVHFERLNLAALDTQRGANGLVVVNPPYGERIGDREQLRELYRLLGERMRESFTGWQLALLTGNPPLARELGLRARRSHTLWNGPIECRLLRFAIEPEAFEHTDPDARRQVRLAAARERPGAQMFANRLRKNLRSIGRWARTQDVDCYRLYDADMPEYAFAIDVYGDGSQRWVFVQEYAAPATVERSAADARRLEAMSVLPDVLGIEPQRVYGRVRRQQRGGAQYDKVATTGTFHIVREGRYRYYANFDDYLDTGLFLDHRLTRERIGALARGRRFLNLFAYTGSMTVCAAGGGAVQSTTVDLSANYLDWARRNLQLNALENERHAFVRADCLEWLESAADDRRLRYDLVFLDPPTHSRSKRMQSDFDVQRDHVSLIRNTAALLSPDGLLVFSCNYSRFRLDRTALAEFAIDDVTAATIPPDFARNPRIHVCYEIRPPSRPGSPNDGPVASPA
jgi:23S rRNA (guanine2445-N2)-methyltransferase / 23S rRNA (guanine2069-N7)-methyltransferase